MQKKIRSFVNIIITIVLTLYFAIGFMYHVSAKGILSESRYYFGTMLYLSLRR